jgi:hypothetical protein
LKSRIHQGAAGETMTTDIISNKRFANSKWAERKQDFLIVSSFGLWALLLGLSPVLAVNFLVGS